MTIRVGDRVRIVADKLPASTYGPLVGKVGTVITIDSEGDVYPMPIAVVVDGLHDEGPLSFDRDELVYTS